MLKYQTLIIMIMILQLQLNWYYLKVTFLWWNFTTESTLLLPTPWGSFTLCPHIWPFPDAMGRLCRITKVVCPPFQAIFGLDVDISCFQLTNDSDLWKTAGEFLNICNKPEKILHNILSSTQKHSQPIHPFGHSLMRWDGYAALQRWSIVRPSNLGLAADISRFQLTNDQRFVGHGDGVLECGQQTWENIVHCLNAEL